MQVSASAGSVKRQSRAGAAGSGQKPGDLRRRPDRPGHRLVRARHEDVRHEEPPEPAAGAIGAAIGAFAAPAGRMRLILGLHPYSGIGRIRSVLAMS